MAILKKGSKGKPVEELQTLVNKLGIKPELKVDGIFGPLTDKGLRAAQKKLKMETIDGKAGERTLAALKFGKPLPKMETPDYAKLHARAQITERNNRTQFALYVELDQQVADMMDSLDKLMPAFATMRSANTKTWPKLLAAGKRIVDGQKKFEKLVTVNPFEAEKLAADIARYYEEAKSFRADITAEAEKFGTVYKNTAAKIYASGGSIDKSVTAIGKGIEQARKDKAALG